MVDKIQKFIKLNNLHDAVYNHKPNIKVDLSEQEDYLAAIDYTLQKLENVLNKRHMVSILEDGSKELKEMLNALWTGIAVITTYPGLNCQYEYKLQDGRVLYYLHQ